MYILIDAYEKIQTVKKYTMEKLDINNPLKDLKDKILDNIKSS